MAVFAAKKGDDDASSPNIIVILSDDMGFSDIGCYGGEAETPVLDKLAEDGLRFTQFYNTGRCCPTRASLLTGLYPHQAGVGHMMSDRGYDGYRGELNRRAVTIAEVLKPAGYATYLSGKWHVTTQIAPDGSKDNWPLQRGFDRFYGTIHGAGSLWDPNTLTRDNTQISPYADPDYKPKDGFFYTDAISDHAVRFIKEHDRARKDDPFFMYVAYTSAHWPMHARERDIEKYEGRFDEGYAPTREERLKKLKQLGVLDERWEPNPLRRSWDDVPEDHREWESANMEVYSAMIDSMDQGIGKIVHELRRTKRLDNTLILFMQDNGGCAETYGWNKEEGPRERPKKPTLEPMGDGDLQPNMTPTQDRAGNPMRRGPNAFPGPADTAVGYGPGWATVSNTPFREYKHYVHEGGVATPLIAHWPKGISADDGSWSTTRGHLVDIMTTCVEISGADYPVHAHGGSPIRPMEGSSLTAAFAGEETERGPIYWEHEGNRAVRVGEWKLVAKGAKGAWELYHIPTDRSEQHDLVKEQPERAEALALMWQRYAERALVLPLNPQRPKEGGGK